MQQTVDINCKHELRMFSTVPCTVKDTSNDQENDP